MPKAFTYEEATEPSKFSFEEAQPEPHGYEPETVPIPAPTPKAPLWKTAPPTEKRVPMPMIAPTVAIPWPTQESPVTIPASGLEPPLPIPKLNITPGEKGVTPTLKAIANFGLSIPEFAESSVGMATTALGPIAPRVLSAVFTADMVKNLIQQTPETVRQWEKMTPAQKQEAAVNLILGTAMAGYLGKKTITGWGKQAQGKPNETQREIVSTFTELAQKDPETFTGLLKDAVKKAVPIEEREPTAPVPPPIARAKEPESDLVTDANAKALPNAAKEVEKPLEQPAAPAAQPERAPDASSIEEATKVHGNVRPLVEPASPLPVKEGGEGVQPQATGGLPKAEEAARPAQGTFLLTPAVQAEGQTFTGKSHAEAVVAAARKGVDATKAEHVFLDAQGKVLNRQEAAKVFTDATGKTPANAEGLHSEDLRDAGLLEAKATPLAPVAREGAAAEAPKPSAGSAVTSATGAGIAAPEPARQPTVTPELRKSQAAAAGAGKEPPRVARGVTQRMRFAAESEFVGEDILSWIVDNMPILSKTGAKSRWGIEKFKANSGLYDDAPSRLGSPHHNIIYSVNGRPPDVVAQALYEAGKISSPDVGEMWNAIDAASKGRVGTLKKQKAELRWLEREAKLTEEWEAGLSKEKGKTELTSDDLKVGDVIEVAGEKFEATDVDPDTGQVTLKDGRKFGVQTLPSGKQIYVEDYIEVPSEEAGKELEPPSPVQTPKLGAMEKGTGDLLKGQTEDFRLVGEKGVDAERIARQKEQAAKAKAEADALAAKQQQAFVGMGGAVPGEFRAQGQTITGIRNAVVDQERAKHGLPPAMEPARRSFGEVWDRAMAVIDSQPDYQDRLIRELDERPRALTDTEDAALLHRQIDLQNEYAKATHEIAQAADDAKAATTPEMADARKGAMVEAQARLAGWREKLYQLYEINKKAGTETARGLSARRMLADEDFNLAKMEIEKRAVNGGQPLTPAQAAEVKRLHDEITARQKAFDEYVSKTDARLLELETQKAMAEAKSGVLPFDKRILDYAERFVQSMEKTADRYRQELSGALWSPTPDMLAKAAYIGATRIARGTVELAKWTDEMVSMLGEGFRKHAPQVYEMAQKRLDAELAKTPEKVRKAVKSKTPDEQKQTVGTQIKDKFNKGLKSELSFYVRKLARLFAEDGVSDREEMVTNLHQFIAHDIPNITRRQVQEMFSGYGDYRRLRQDEISILLRGMKGELQQILKLEDMAAGKPPLKSGLERRTPTEAERQLIKRVNDAKYKFQIPVQDPETQLKSSLDTLKTTLRNRITDLQDRIARKDFDPRPRREIVMDREAMELKAQAEKVKRQWRQSLLADQLKNRSRYEKTMDTLVKWRRGFVLSGFTTLGKLTSAAAQRMTFTPTEEVIGSLWAKIPGIRGVAERAPREGSISVRAEAKAITEAFSQGMRDSYRVLKEGHGALDYLFGGKDTYIGELDAEQRSIVDFFGHIHGALKAPVKRAEFARSFQKRVEWNMRQGVDVTDPLVQAKIAVEAYKDGNRAIFLQDNFLASRIRRFINSLEERQKATGKPTWAGKAGATAARFLVPITKVPTNIVAETLTYAAGLEHGLYRAAKAIRAGTANLKPEEADIIMRELKKGSIGTAFLLVGYFSPQIIGGYYQRQEKKRPGVAKPGTMRLAGLNVPTWMLHNPLLETLQIGATIRRVADAKLRKRDTEAQGIGSGIVAGAVGLTEQVPWVREMLEVAKVGNPYERGAFFGELTKSAVIPQGVQQAARYFDKNAAGETVSRKPRTMWEHVKTGLPGLRQEVPKSPKQPTQ